MDDAFDHLQRKGNGYPRGFEGCRTKWNFLFFQPGRVGGHGVRLLTGLKEQGGDIHVFDVITVKNVTFYREILEFPYFALVTPD